MNRMADFDWEDARYFLALARAGSLSGAARALRVNHATVARRISALETAIGRRLFDRGADGYRLTVQGQAAIEIATSMEASAVALRESMARDTVLGTVRVTTVRSIADAFGVAMLPRYLGDPDASLREVDFGEPYPPRELWLLSPGELARTARVRAVMDAVAEAVAEAKALLEGAGRF